MLRAKVTYTADDNAATTDVDEEGWPIWVEYTEVLTVSGDVANNPPALTQANYEIRVQLAATKTVGTGEDKMVLQPAVTPPKPDAPDPEVPGLEDDADDSDDDGPGIPPDDGGAFIDDHLLDSFVLAIDDIDVA